MIDYQHVPRYTIELGDLEPVEMVKAADYDALLAAWNSMAESHYLQVQELRERLKDCDQYDKRTNIGPILTGPH